MRGIADALQSIAVALWVGGLWVIGYAVAPVLFSTLTDRALAGLVAGRLFSLMAGIGLGCAAYLILYRLACHGAAALRQGLFRTVLAMLALTLAGEFGVQPVMAALKAQAQALPVQVMESALRDRFVLWHGVASVLYLLQSALGGFMIIGLRK